MQPELLALLLHEADYISDQIALAKRGAILPGLNSETIANIEIALPPHDQQVALLQFLREQRGQFDQLVADAQLSIHLLQERRSALISAAVTGKIDVRGLVPQPEVISA
jgi:type I restriction enzyme S subunit